MTILGELRILQLRRVVGIAYNRLYNKYGRNIQYPAGGLDEGTIELLSQASSLLLSCFIDHGVQFGMNKRKPVFVADGS